MSEENLNQDEKDESNSQAGSESEDALDELFKSDDDSQEELEDSEKVKHLEERLGNIEKGVNKFFSENGRKQKEEIKPAEKKEEAQAKPQINPVLKTLYFDKFPETKEVWAEVEKEAKLLNKDPFELYESSSYFKGEAKARHDAKLEDEANKEKISKPSSGTGKKLDFSNVKSAEDYVKMTPAQRAAYNELQKSKEE